MATTGLERTLLQVGERLGLPSPERTIPGTEGRSHVALYADSVLKLYAYKPELNRTREVEALRRWRHTELVPRLLAYDDGDEIPWTHMTRTPGVLLGTVPVAERSEPLIRDVGRALGELHTTAPVRADVELPSKACRVVYGHGDFAARNVMVEGHRMSGLIDVEKSQPVCFAADLAMYLMLTLMGQDAHWDSCLAGYLERNTGPLDLGAEHLAVHLELIREWAGRMTEPNFTAQAEQAISSALRTGQGFRQPSR